MMVNGVHVTLSDMIDCQRRELARRRREFPRLVDRGILRDQIAAVETARAEAILRLLEETHNKGIPPCSNNS